MELLQRLEAISRLLNKLGRDSGLTSDEIAKLQTETAKAVSEFEKLGGIASDNLTNLISLLDSVNIKTELAFSNKNIAPAGKAIRNATEDLREYEAALQRIGRTARGGSSPTGAQQPLEEEKRPDADLFTWGTPSVLNPAYAQANADAIGRAYTQVKNHLTQVYTDLGYELDTNYVAKIDAATGEISMQVKAWREVGQAINEATGELEPINQEVTARSRGSIFGTQDPSEYTQAQDAFIASVGGIDRAKEELGKMGLELSNVVGVHKQLNSEVTRFAVVGPDGYSSTMIHVDRLQNVIMETARNAKTFTQNVARNIGKVIEWSVATGAVYGIISQIVSAAKDLTEIEDTFADITIATGAGTEELQRFYDSAVDIANVTGTQVVDALSQYQKALRASSSAANQNQTAAVLLTDALTLSRLGNLEQAESLDILIGALRQTGMSFEEGSTLLDKWVAVSQNAGVSIEDMAQSFATTASVAETVGVSIDELNGLVAVLAENTTLSSTEIGNALRTMLSNITSPEATKQLENFGIAVKDVDGNMRDWMDITEDIVGLMNTGLINEEQVNRLANALGGGSRRGPQLIAIWKNLAEVQALAAQSASADGEAAAAMEAKLNTLRTSVNNLQNSLNSLVQTLGFEGGFLELAKEGVDLLTGFVKVLDDVAGSLDNSTAYLVAFGAGFLTLQRGINSGVLPAGLNPSFAARNQLQLAGRSRTGALDPSAAYSNTLGYLYGPNTRTGISGAIQSGAQGVAGSGMPVIGAEIARAFAGEEDAFGKIGGAVAGAFVGNMILPGAGGLIGAIIGDSFVASVQTQIEAKRFYTSESYLTAQPSELMSAIIEDFQTGIGAALGRGPLQGLAFPSGQLDRLDDAQVIEIATALVNSQVFKNLPETAYGTFGASSRAAREPLEAAGLTETQIKIATALLASGPENVKRFTDEVNRYNQVLEEEANRLSGAELPISRFTQAAVDLANRFTGGVTGYNRGARQTAFENAISTGDTGGYGDLGTSLQFAQTTTPRFLIASGRQAGDQESYLEYYKTLQNVSGEEKTRYAELISQWNSIKDAQEEASHFSVRSVELAGQQVDLRRQEREVVEQLNNLYDISVQRQRIDAAKELYSTPTDAREFTKIDIEAMIGDAKRAQDVYFEYLGIDSDLADKMFDPFVVAAADGFLTVEGLSKDMWSEVLKDAKEAVEEVGFSFKDMGDLSVAQYPALAQRTKFFEKLLQDQFGQFGYDEKTQNIGLLFEGNQARVLNTTMTALTLATQELTEIEKKQLEGFWNLPAGATAYVPITSLFYQQQQNLPESTNLPPATSEVSVSVNVAPTVVNVQVDGKTIANAVTRQQSNTYRQTYRGVGHGSGGNYAV